MIRREAFDVVMIKEESSVKLVLCLEPEAACMVCKEFQVLMSIVFSRLATTS